jgi:nucleoside-diphosphate-sugar epimerase
MSTLITGGAGFIGSHLADYLAGKGEHVLVLDDFSSDNKIISKSLDNNELVKIVNKHNNELSNLPKSDDSDQNIFNVLNGEIG